VKRTIPSLEAQHDRRVAELIRLRLREHAGNTSRAAAALGVPRTTLLRLIEKHGLQAETSSREGRPPAEKKEDEHDGS
jgi:DNA-binding NtrC family response regulator